MQFLDIKPKAKDNMQAFSYWLNDQASWLVSVSVFSKKIEVKESE